MASEDPTDTQSVGETPGSAETDRTAPSVTDAAQGKPPQPKVPLGKRVLRWCLALLMLLLLLAFAYRWAGTTTLRGSVQRVYEKEAHYRIEFVQASGEVHVLENEVIQFPYLKTDTADLQAALHRYSETGDIIEVTSWGFRASFISMFPNVVDVEFIRSNDKRQKEQIQRITQSVMDELIDQGKAHRGDESERMRPGLEKAIRKAVERPTPADGDASPAQEAEP